MKKQVKVLLNAVIKWAEGNPGILGVALVGSYARDEARADSDIDLVLLASTPKKLLGMSDWIKEFGEVKSFKIEDWGLVTSLRVFYQGGLEVEYGMTTSEWASEPIGEGTRQVIADGMKILLDKSGLLTRALKEVSGKGGS